MTVNDELDFIQHYFPDGSGVILVHKKRVLETFVDEVKFTENLLNGLDPDSTPPLMEVFVDLTELEPETDIWAAMSQRTHIVYVFVGPNSVL